MKNFGSEWKRRLKAGEFLIGGHIFLPNPALAEAMACFGYQYIWIDGEHGAFDREEIYTHLATINGAGAGAFVRVAALDAALIKPVLEMGPDGLIVPMINSPEEAAELVSLCTYPPGGTRGFGPRRANRYGVMPDEEYLKSVDESLVVTIQIEHIDAVNRIEGIVAVPGIGGVVIGPYDLSASMGLLGQMQHPEVKEQCRRIVAACKAGGVPCGPSIGPGNEAVISFWLGLGVDFMFCGDDLSFVKTGTETTLAKIASLRG